MIETLFLVLTVICIIFYLGGQIKNSSYTKSNTVYILVMLILTIVGFVVVKYVPYPMVQYGFTGLVILTILIINILEYAKINV
jgi:membrane-associated HD superfamily phosphohydrolase